MPQGQPDGGFSIGELYGIEVWSKTLAARFIASLESQSSVNVCKRDTPLGPECLAATAYKLGFAYDRAVWLAVL